MVDVSKRATSHHRSLRTPLVLVMTVTLIAWVSLSMVGAPAAHAAGVPYAKGDVFVGIGNGQIAHYSPTGTLLDTLNNTTGSSEQTGMCFDTAGNLYSTNFEANSVSKFDSAGNLLQANFGSGFNQDPESCLQDGAGNLYVGEADGTHRILKFNTSGTLLAAYSPITDRGTDWIDLASDQCTMFYDSESATMRRFNVCTNTQLADFTNAMPAPCFALRIRSNGDVMAACSSAVVRLNSSGAIVQTYPAASLPNSSSLFALNIDPDGTTFWTADYSSGQVSHVDIATGSVIASFNAPHVFSVAGLAIFGEQTVSNPCNGDTTAPAASFTKITDVNGKPAVQVTITDPDNNLATAVASGTNLQVINNTTGTVLQTLTSTLTTVNGFVPNTSKTFTFVAEKINTGAGASLTVQSTDLCNNVGDPTFQLHGKHLHGHLSADHRSIIVDMDKENN